MGKRAYAESLYGKSISDSVCDLEYAEPESMLNAKLIINLHLGVRQLVIRGVNAEKFFLSCIDKLKQCVIIGDEIGGGVVPIGKFERQWRDETGLVYQFIADRADIVDRIWAGLALRLKG